MKTKGSEMLMPFLRLSALFLMIFHEDLIKGRPAPEIAFSLVIFFILIIWLTQAIHAISRYSKNTTSRKSRSTQKGRS